MLLNSNTVILVGGDLRAIWTCHANSELTCASIRRVLSRFGIYMPGVTSGHLPRCAGADAVRLAGARLPVREDARVEALAGLWMRTPSSVIARL